MISCTRYLSPASILPVLALTVGACGDNGGAGDPGVDATTADAPAAPQPGLTVFDFEIAVDVSPDGRLALFEDLTQDAVLMQIHDTVTGVTSSEGPVGDPARNLLTGISNTGRVSALHNDPVQAGLWTKAGGWLDLGSAHPAGCDLDVSAAFDVSADGHVAVGLDWNGCSPDAFRWSDADGSGAITTLPALGSRSGGGAGNPTNRATVISDDGQVAGGFAEDGNVDRRAALWPATGPGMLLDTTGSDAPSEVLSISADGRTAAGLLGTDGFVWTSAGGMVTLVRFDGALPSDAVFPNAMSGDGSHVYGGVGDAFFTIPTAFVWTAAGGMRPLADVVTAAGITVPTGFIFGSVLGVSADGTVLAGTALDADGNAKTYVLRLPTSAL